MRYLLLQMLLFQQHKTTNKIIGDLKQELLSVNAIDKSGRAIDIKKFKYNAKKILGKDLIIDRCLATSDAIYFSEKNIPCILINPNGNYWHNPKEYVEIDSLYTLYLLFETLI